MRVIFLDIAVKVSISMHCCNVLHINMKSIVKFVMKGDDFQCIIELIDPPKKKFRTPKSLHLSLLAY